MPSSWADIANAVKKGNATQAFSWLAQNAPDFPDGNPTAHDVLKRLYELYNQLNTTQFVPHDFPEQVVCSTHSVKEQYANLTHLLVEMACCSSVAVSNEMSVFFAMLDKWDEVLLAIEKRRGSPLFGERGNVLHLAAANPHNYFLLMSRLTDCACAGRWLSQQRASDGKTPLHIFLDNAFPQTPAPFNTTASTHPPFNNMAQIVFVGTLSPMVEMAFAHTRSDLVTVDGVSLHENLADCLDKLERHNVGLTPALTVWLEEHRALQQRHRLFTGVLPVLAEKEENTGKKI